MQFWPLFAGLWIKLLAWFFLMNFLFLPEYCPALFSFSLSFLHFSNSILSFFFPRSETRAAPLQSHARACAGHACTLYGCGGFFFLFPSGALALIHTHTQCACACGASTPHVARTHPPPNTHRQFFALKKMIKSKWKYTGPKKDNDI